jgi:hypothetical protein
MNKRQRKKRWKRSRMWLNRTKFANFAQLVIDYKILGDIALKIVPLEMSKEQLCKIQGGRL